MTGASAYSHDYDREALIEQLWDAYEVLGESPSMNQLGELNDFPSKEPYINEFGSWTAAKEAAGMEASKTGWNARLEKTKVGVYRKELSDGECRLCPEDADCALTFHHPPDVEKRAHVSVMKSSGEWSASDIEDEIDKCITLCANCHSKLHSDSHPLEVKE